MCQFSMAYGMEEKMRSEVPEVKRVYSAVCKGDSGHRVAEHTEILEALQRRSPSDAR